MMPGIPLPATNPCVIAHCIEGAAPLWFLIVMGIIVLSVVAVCIWGVVCIYRIEHPKEKEKEDE